ncbi:type IV secretory system conjugative DNA transfer family protein [Gordonia aquimaris]|uniref:Type IV secretion system DNA-binding domain-containing protein n=1 Tax=Gordonia aquimaris TaxID=2984863 RepID=A0A9X3DAW3_9ACTN|nr:type IV secretion system DNA-binding domain-containing protein [Gordonia aquimaris]MCX2966847.1 type IV secretion system DNA-binding domain-containing protein [Gordonia aquimaris]
MSGQMNIERDGGPEPERIDVRIDALRRHSTERAAELRAELPTRLAGLLIEAPDATVSTSLIVDDEGIVDARVSVTGRCVDEVAQATDALLRVVGETDSRPKPLTQNDDVLGEWAIVPDDTTCRLGFAIDAAKWSSAPQWSPRSVLDAAGLAAELSAMAHTGIRVEARTLDGDTTRCRVRLTALGSTETPSIQLRALVRRRFSGLVISANAENPRMWLTVESDELAGVVAIPVGGPDPTPGFYTAPAAPIAVGPTRRHGTGTAIRLGHAVTTIGRQLPVELPEPERRRHVQVVGQTGTGKSSTIAALVHEIAAGDEGCIVLDPHGTLIDRILAELPSDSAERTWVIRCGDVDNPVPISTLAESDPVRRDVAIADTCAIFQEIFDKKETGIVGPRFQERVAMAMRAGRALYGDTASILDVPMILSDDLVMTEAVTRTDDERLTAWFANDKSARRSSDHGELVSWVNSKFEPFSNTAAVRGILGSGYDALDFASLMDEGQVILVALSKADLGESATRLLGYLYLNRVWAGALTRKRTDRSFTVVVDEAQSLLAGSLSSMLSEGRKFGLSVVIAHQFLGQLDEDLRPAVDGNVATTIAFRSAVSDAAALSVRFGGLVDTTTLTTLPDLSAVLMRNSGPAAVPHTLIVDHNERVAPRTGGERTSFDDEIICRTHRELVDPYRDRTAAAVRGVSHVAQTRRELKGRDRGARPGPESNFLADWVAKREATTSTEPTSTEPTEPAEAS